MSKRGNDERSDENGFEEFGGYMAAKQAKLNHQFNESKDSGCVSSIFNGVSIHINGYVNPTNLRLLFIQHGGQYHPFPHSSTNFVIASNLADATKRKWGSITLKADWVLDSIAQGEKLDHKNYFLYDYNEENRQKTLKQAFKIVSKDVSEVRIESNLVQQAEPPHQEVNSDDWECIAESVAESPQQVGKRLKAWEDGFLEEFWNHSRLHNISTMKRTLQLRTSKLRRTKETHVFAELQKYEDELRNSQSQQQGEDEYEFRNSCLFLVDMDCFFVAVGRLSRPHMNNIPVVVTHFSGNRKMVSNSDIACASYEARKFGIRNGMWVSQAKELCPDIQVIPYDFDAYQRTSSQFFNTIAGLTLDVEPGSIDELLIDVTSILRNVPGSSPISLANFLRKRIFDVTWCKASVGIGSNRLLAKLASKKAKPDGVFMITEKNLPSILKDQPFGDLPGIGYSLREKFQTQFSNVKTCGDLQQLKLEELKSYFGAKKGDILYKSCRGIDDNGLQFDFERPKSISIDVNYGIRLTENWHLEKLLLNIAKALSKRAVEAEACGTKINISVLTRQKGAPEPQKSGGHGYVDVHNKSAQLMNPTRNHLVLFKSILSLIRSVNMPVEDYRGIGVHLTGLKFDFDGKKEVQQTLMSVLQKQQERPRIEPSLYQTNVTNKENTERSPTKPPVPVQAERAIVPTTEVRNPLKELMGIESIDDLDMEVLLALPDDIAKEIISFFGDKAVGRLQNANSNQPSTSRAALLVQKLGQSTSTVTEIPAPIGQDTETHDEMRQAHETSEEEDNNDGPNLSESFLDGLPEDLREEVKADMQQIREVSREAKQAKILQQQHAFSTLVQNGNTHYTRPAEVPKLPNVPIVDDISRIGVTGYDVDDENDVLLRAVGKKADYETKDQISFNRVNWFKFKHANQQKKKLPTKLDPKGYTLVTSRLMPKTYTMPSLNEMTELGDVRRVIREGMQEMPNPTKADLDGLTEYFRELLTGPYLKHVQILLKFLTRLSEKPSTNHKWKLIIQLIIGICQNKIEREYGFPVQLHDLQEEPSIAYEAPPTPKRTPAKIRTKELSKQFM